MEAQMQAQQQQQITQAGIDVGARKLGNTPSENLTESLQTLQQQIGQQ